MAVKFRPTGQLDINTDPSVLPYQSDGKNEVSGAMVRCTNLSLDTPGLAITRNGSSKINTTAIDQLVPYHILEMGGDRYEFAGTKIYVNEQEIDSNLTSAQWSAIEYSAYNVTDYSVFCTNGTDRKRIPGTSTVNAAYNYAYSHSWEADNASGTTYQFGTTRSNYQCWFDWEESTYSYQEEEDDSINPFRYLWIYEGFMPRPWGIAAPIYKPYLFSNAASFSSRVSGYAYMHEWEGTYHATTASTRIGDYREWTIETLLPVDPKEVYHIVEPVHDDGDYDIVPNAVQVSYEHAQSIFSWEKVDDADATTNPVGTWYFETATSYSDTVAVGVRYTWCRKNGNTLEFESNPSPVGVTQGITMVTASWPPPPDGQITHVRIYRTLEGDATFYYAAEFEADALTGTFNTSDAALGSEVAIDHNRPPAGTVVAGPSFNGYVFMIKDNLLYYCKPNQPEYWPSDYYIEVCPPQETLKAIQIHNGVPYVISTEDIYMIQGSGATSFFPFKMKAKVGCLSDKGALSLGGLGITHIDTNGFYQFKGANEDTRFSDDKFNPLFSGVTTGSIPGLNRTYASNCWLFSHDNKLWFGFPDTTATYPNNVIVFNLLTMRGVHFSYPFQIGSITLDNTNNRILAFDSTGFVRVLDDPTVTNDSGTAISWQLESKSFTDQLYKYFPRYAKYDVTVGSGGAATGNILLNDSIIQTHTLSTTRTTVKRHINGNNGDRLGIRVTGTGSVTIREIEVE